MRPLACVVDSKSVYDDNKRCLCDFRFGDLFVVLCDFSLWAFEMSMGLSLLDFDSSGLEMIG